MFTEGFEKEAGFKHVALAGMMAMSPAKARAGSNVMDALKTTGQAARETNIGKAVSGRANEYLKKAQNVHLWGKSGEGAAASAAGGAKGAIGSRASASPNLSLKDGKRLTLDYGRFSGSAEPGKLKGSYDLGKGFSAEGSAIGGERRASLNFKREF